MRRVLALISILLPAGIFATPRRFPAPEFTTGYQWPTMTTPAAKAVLFAYLDIGLLALALALAAYLALRARSRRGVFALTVLSIAYFGFYRHGCVCPVGSIQNVALALGPNGYALSLLVGAFFLLPLLFALFFGRVFCSSVCPLGAAQELALIRPLTVPRWLEHGLGLIPYLYLGAAVLLAYTGAAFLICQYDPFVLFFRLGGSQGMLLVGLGVLLSATVIGRPYCRFFCPYGVLLRWLAPLARWRVDISSDACVTCTNCVGSCPYNAIHPPTPPGPIDRREGKARLALLILLLPVLIALGGWLGFQNRNLFAQLHPTVRMAERLRQEEGKLVTGTTEASNAFRQLGKPNTDAYHEALELRHRFAWGSLFFGAWVGLVIGGKLIALAVRRRREATEADPATCVACGRCYQACPVSVAAKRETALSP
ncbi:MAG: 4Fe-4S binding protein [Armatimonadota bacterium]